MIALAGKACGICGGPIAANNRTGFCRRTAECRRAYYRAYNHRPMRDCTCELCGHVLHSDNEMGVCRTNLACRAEHQRRWWARLVRETQQVKTTPPSLVFPVHAIPSCDNPGHAGRLAGHEARVWGHRCERADGQRCDDCIYAAPPPAR